MKWADSGCLWRVTTSEGVEGVLVLLRHVYIRTSRFLLHRGNFERARDIYEEGIETVKTVRDFSIIFDAYTQLEESLIAAQMENLEEEDDDDDGKEADPNEEWKVQVWV